ncbi:MAG: hypothetical protein LQ352_007251 [Teloschistes flavicans]|nr:MAG: hypothetical protein LQ352_007251 [Teloschistes flavicans]
MAIQQLVNLVLLLDIRIAAFITILYDQAARLMSDWTYTSESIDTWQFWFISSRGNEYFCEIDEDYLTDRFNLTGLNADVQYYQYALDLVTDVFDLDCEDDMREQIEKSARHLYGLVHARYITTTRGLAKMVNPLPSLPSFHSIPSFLYQRPSTNLTRAPARQIQKRRFRQMPARALLPAPAPPDRHVRQRTRPVRETLLQQVRGPLQPEILAPRHHRRRLLRHLLHQHPLPGLPGPRAREEQGKV